MQASGVHLLLADWELAQLLGAKRRKGMSTGCAVIGFVRICNLPTPRDASGGRPVAARFSIGCGNVWLTARLRLNA